MSTLIGTLYAIIIFSSCVLGAIVGLGGGVFIRPIFDAIGYHNVLNISFFASSAILTMAIVSTAKRLKDGTKIDLKTASLISGGAICGGMLGNLLLEHLVAMRPSPADVQWIQIQATIAVLTLSLILTAKSTVRHEIKSSLFPPLLGLSLGVIGAFLGMGGGPLNVPLFMIFFGLSIKEATAYSIVVIFFTHLSRLVTMGLTVGYGYFDLRLLLFVIPAAALGGLVGARCSKLFSETTVRRLFLLAVFAVIVLNIVNGLFVI